MHQPLLPPFARRAVPVAIAAVAVAAMVLPVAMIFLTAFKAETEIVHFASIFPRRWTLENFRRIFDSSEEIPILRWLFNSVLVSSSVTLLVLLVDSLAAYAFARLKPPGGRAVFALLVATLMVPGQVLLVPMYLILDGLGWIDSLLALVVPAGAGAFGVFLLHQFFLGIPRELEEAVVLDGCSRLRIWWHIVLPLSRPALAALGILTFIGAWNDFLGPLVFIDSAAKYTLPVGIALFQSSYKVEYGLTLAASVICTLPVLVLFAVLQRHIIEGVSFAGLKE